jgi:hypothetical protein
MKKLSTLLIILTTLIGSAQDFGKISVRNKENNYPKFYSSLNGIRSGLEFQHQVIYDLLDEKVYKIKIYQQGNTSPLVFNIGNSIKYQTNYVLNKDEFGNFTLATEGKVIFATREEVAVTTSTSAATISIPANTLSTSPATNVVVAVSATTPAAPDNSVAVTAPSNTVAPPAGTVIPNYSSPTEMDNESYTNIFNSIKKESVDNNKMTTAKTFIADANLSSNQVLGIVKLFNFESNRLAFAKWAYQKTLDKKNYIKVYDGLTFSSSKKDLAEYIKNNP